MVDYDFNPSGITIYNTTIYSQSTFYDCKNSSGLSKIVSSIPFFPFGLGICIVSTFGIFGNLLCGVVLHNRLRSSYSVLTLGLLVADTIYLLTKLLRYGLSSGFSHWDIFFSYTDIFLPIFGPYLRPTTFCAHTASTYFTIAIAFDRYIVLSRPSKARRFCTTSRAWTISFLVVIFAILFNILRWWEFHTDSCSDSFDGSTIYYMKISNLRNHPNYKLYYIFWIYFIVMFLTPFVLLTIMNILIWRMIRNIQKCGVTLNYTQSRDTSFSAMLVGIVVVFLICNLDYLILDILEYLKISYSRDWIYLGNFLLTVNSGANFLIYCVCGQKFREELVKILSKMCSCCCKGKTASHDITDTSDGWVKENTKYEKSINLYQLDGK